MINLLHMIEVGEILEIRSNTGIQELAQMHCIPFLNQWCELFGSTYEGRKQACAKRMNIKQKVPILISEVNKDIVFPTCNTRSYDCVWINYRAIDECYGDPKKSKVLFLDGSTYELACDIRILRREQKLCFEYLALITSSSR